MIGKMEVMQIRRDVSPKRFHLRNDTDDLKGLQQNLKHNFYRYLLQSETCQLESACGEKKGKCTFEKTTMFSSKVHRARRINKDSQSKPHSKLNTNVES